MKFFERKSNEGSGESNKRLSSFLSFFTKKQNDDVKLGSWAAGAFLMSALTSMVMLSFLGQYRAESGKVSPDGKQRIIDLQPGIDDWVRKNPDRDSAVAFYDLKNDVKMGEYNGRKKYKIPALLDFPLVYDGYSKFANKFFNAESKIDGDKTRKNCIEALFLRDDVNCRGKTLDSAGAQILKTSMQSYYGMADSDLENYTVVDVAKLAGLIYARNGFSEDLQNDLQDLMRRGATSGINFLKETYKTAQISGRAGKGYVVAILSYNNGARVFGVVGFGEESVLREIVKLGDRIER